MQSPELRQKRYSLCNLPPDVVAPLKSVLVQERGESLLCVTSTNDLLVIVCHHLHFSIHPLRLFRHPPNLGRGSPDRHPLGSSDVEDGTDAQEETPEDGPQFGDQVKLHHFTQLGVVAGSMGLELEKEKVRKCKLAAKSHMYVL